MHIVLFTHAIGTLGSIQAALAQAEDKSKAILDLAMNYEPDEETMRQPFGPRANKGRREIWAALSMALMRQVECLQKERYDLSDFVERIRKRNLGALCRYDDHARGVG